MSQEPIAVIGTACRFAGDIDTPSKLWELLKKPSDLRQEIPKERFNTDGFYHHDHAYHGHTNVRHSYLLSQDPAAFDAEFFSINPIEARSMDPQQRLTLETVYEAIEAAGLTMEGMSGSDTCVYAGSMTADYDAMGTRDLDHLPTYAAVGTSRAILSNRISYFFNWKGASVTMDTACSSSLVALHSAIQDLRLGDSGTAVICGSNLILGPECFIIESTVKMLSPDGLSRMWDKDANGYARGEGLAALVIKPLSAALRDNDHIECLIRGTGINQDGNTAGLTMPSPISQRALIQSTYAKAGLDLNKVADRPQYFEAHGTGTPAGDPVEAEAIHTAFMASTAAASSIHNEQPLYVGSIKTVLGHTEGTAGIAGLMKAMLAIQNSCIPPNLHLHELNPAIEPFYRHLQVPQSHCPWPRGDTGQVRRASVNSFGFGGSNAHAIIESYDDNPAADNATGTTFGPFVFSAASEKALRSNLQAYIDYLQSTPDCSASDLAYTLRSRRSLLQYRLAVSAADCATLREKLVEFIAGDGTAAINGIVRTLSKIGSESTNVLGVFTGQGAQYAAMAAELIRASPGVRQIIGRLEGYLLDLPKDDQPSWSLEAELLADAETSRIGESSLSQPLNTAVQIMLVDLLRAAGVHFDAVVGHSSGEIAAAYAAGFLSAKDAMYISYYRGICCRYAQSPNGEIPGAMLAVGTSMEDALELCQDETFVGRICLAAVNSPSSVTVSGDSDAIEELVEIMEDEKKFHRRLRVDMAYHSNHMKACTDAYRKGMARAGISTIRTSLDRSCRWYSSVYDGKLVDESFDLSGNYWLENLIQPVMFAPALSTALTSSGVRYDAALEIGPHPALQGPATQIMQDALPSPIPYNGTLQRNGSALTSLSATLGFLWSHLDTQGINLDQFEREMAGNETLKFRLLKNLPRYQWNHDTSYWSESRRSRHLRGRSEPVHPLLGHITADSGSHTLRWKHVLKPIEMPWLKGHAVQNQIVFPAAGYISTAMEAVLFLARDETIQLIDLGTFDIHQAIPFSGEGASIEVLVELSQIARSHDDQELTANFSYSAALGGSSGNMDMSLVATAEIHVRFAEPSANLLAERQLDSPHMIDIKPQRMYDWLASLEYNFSDPFRSLTKLRRKLGLSRCAGQAAPRDVDTAGLWVHPADLDAAFQAVNLAFSFPGDEQIRHLHLPTTISNIRVNPAALGSPNNATNKHTYDEFNVDAVWSPSDPLIPTSGISGNASLYFGQADTQYVGIQFDNVVLQPIGEANDERKIYHGLEYVPTHFDGTTAANELIVTDEILNLMWTLHRVVHFYAQQFDREVPADDPMRTSGGVIGHYLNFCKCITNEMKQGVSRWGKSEWVHDTKEDVMKAVQALGPTAENTVDVKLILFVGETMPRVFRGEADMLEELRLSDLLGDFYQYGAGLQQATMWIKASLKQITNRSPHLRMVELGAGTAAASKDILNTIGRDFEEYTLTDISSSFAEGALESLSGWGDRISFKTCNVEVDPIEQGFVEGDYDVAIASQILHATPDLGQTVRNIRRMLKPGGWLLMGECSPDGQLRDVGSFIFGNYSGWWNGVHEGRIMSPFASFSQWDKILKENGFGGIEIKNPDHTADAFGIVCIAAQAVDTRVSILRSPLSSPANLDVDKVLLIGGESKAVSPIVTQIQKIFVDLQISVVLYRELEDLDDQIDTPGAAVISLADVDSPVFENMTSDRWNKFQQLFIGQKSVLWVSCGRLKDGLYSNMTVGFGRVALNEEADLRIQNLDFADVSQLNARRIAEAFVRFTNKGVVDGASKNQILHTDEREIVFDVEGRELVPRLSHQTKLNDRLRSIHRAAPYETDLQTQEVLLEHNSSGRFLRQLSRFDKAIMENGSGDEFLQLRTTHSTLYAIRTPLGFQSLVMGVNHEGSKYLALTESTTSALRVSSQCAVRVEQGDMDDPSLLHWAATRLAILAIFETALPGQRMIVHNAPIDMFESITAESQNRGVKVTFTAAASQENALQPTIGSTPCVQLQPYSGLPDIRSAVDTKVAYLVDFSRESNALSTALGAAVPTVYRKENLGTLYAPVAAGNISSDSPKESLRILLQQALQGGKPEVGVENLACIGLGEVIGANQDNTNDPLTVVDWTKETSLPARVCRLDVSPMFKEDKTYWLCGLSGALGISICDWMIDRGVRNMVISSRNPRMDQRWVDNHSAHGVTIKIMSCDVTDEDAVRKVHQDIVQSLPPIAGVVSAAMVLRDVSVRNMQYDQLQEVIRPKVLGSIHLDRIFHDINLDFFIVLSSTNAIIGNAGQANYAAANMGMAGVANRRRHRGLRASVAHVGAIMGVGYVTDSIERLELAVAMTNMIRVGEQEVHQMIAEVFEAGFQDSTVHSELVMGLKEVSRMEPGQSKWSEDPKFCRLLLPSSASDSNRGAGGAAEESVKEKLEGCKTDDEVYQVLRHAFAVQLRKVLFVKLSDDEITDSASSNLGLDSLIAVDIRSWILKTFSVNLPVLQIMSADARISDIVAGTMQELPQRMTPLLDRKEEEKENTEAKDSTTDSDTTKSNGDRSSTAGATGVTTPQDLSPIKDGQTPSASFWDLEALAPARLVVREDAATSWNAPKTILLTGSTGLLGHHILEALLQQSSIQKVICIGIRNLSQRLAAAELPPSSTRIEYHEGDLAVPGFGLNETLRTRIFDTVDAVIHNGADTSHMKSYASVHDTNVESTRQLIRLCVPRRTPIHYISSAGIALASSVQPFPSIAVDGSSGRLDEISRSGARGYMCSKWVCERMLEDSHREYGLPVFINRPSTIIRDGEDAKTQRAGFDWVNALLQYVHATSAVPRVRHNTGSLDLVSVQTCCKDILAGVMSSGSITDGVKYQNNVGDMVIPLANFDDIAIKERGLAQAYPKLPWDEWVSNAVEKGLHPAVAALIESIDEPGGPDYPLLLRTRG